MSRERRRSNSCRTTRLQPSTATSALSAGLISSPSDPSRSSSIARASCATTFSDRRSTTRSKPGFVSTYREPDKNELQRTRHGQYGAWLGVGRTLGHYDQQLLLGRCGDEACEC